MSFTFAMSYVPSYQKRCGICAVCRQGIVAGSQIMIGTGFFSGHLIKNHNHWGCWLREVDARTKNWFFTNKYKPTAMSPEKRAELNRLRARRYYIQKKGGEPDEVIEKLAKVEKRIALVKACD